MATQLSLEQHLEALVRSGAAVGEAATAAGLEAKVPTCAGWDVTDLVVHQGMVQDRFWDMHELLFHRQQALEDSDLRGYAAQLGLDVAAFDRDRASTAVAERIRRDMDSGLASGQVLGTPTLFIDGIVHRGGYDPPTLLAALAP